jgi:hypothetical protein
MNFGSPPLSRHREYRDRRIVNIYGNLDPSRIHSPAT